ncbi:MAG: hypothetical protein OXH31_07765 [Gammaproteobacteria bacterium]|nr:hypothetical protein [Gammaproteobacteria bacterium]
MPEPIGPGHRPESIQVLNSDSDRPVFFETREVGVSSCAHTNGLFSWLVAVLGL